MMKIYILRHGEAVEAEAVQGNDAARTLTPKGEESVRRAAQGMARLEIKPDIIWTSPLPRAAQTARITAEVLKCEKAVKIRRELEPGADPGALAGLIQQGTDGMPVMLVGHNPDLELLVQYLISETDRANIALKKGGLAVIEAERPIHQGCGALIGLWTPKQLAKLME